jgi:hypothetical protein
LFFVRRDRGDTEGDTIVYDEGSHCQKYYVTRGQSSVRRLENNWQTPGWRRFTVLNHAGGPRPELHMYPLVNIFPHPQPTAKHLSKLYFLIHSDRAL